MTLNLYFLPHFISSFIALLFGLFVISRNSQSRKNITYFFICVCVFVWQFTYSIYNFLDNDNRLLIIVLIKISYCFITFIPILNLHHSSELLGGKINKNIIVLFYILNTLICGLILGSNLIIESFYHSYYWGIYPAAGFAHPLYLLYFMTPLALLYLVYQRNLITTNDWHDKNLIKYILTAIVIFNIAILDFIPNYRISLYPIGFLPAVIFISIHAYVTIKYKLMDINLILKKSFVYSLSISSISLIYLILIVSLGELVRIKYNYNSPFLSIFLAFFLGIIFIPLRHRLQKYLEKYFFKSTQEEMMFENEKLRQEITQTEKYKTLATLASGIAHEIRNPLTVIKTFNEYLPARHNDKEFVKKYSQLTNKEIDRISELVNRLMEYSKPNPPKFTDVPVKKLLNQSVDTLNHHLLNKHVHYDRHISINDDLIMRLDPNQIHQALMNIILNAIEAMPNGGELLVRAEVIPRQIKSSIKHNQILEIIITDTGLGIVEEHIKQIFDPFFTNKDFGTGLGLAIVQSIIENHHGRISVKSKVGVGTSVVIEIPIS